MNITKALKTKNRLAGEIARDRNIFARENSKKKGEERVVDLTALRLKTEKLSQNLIAVKTAITVASAPIALKLVTLSELKGDLAWLKELTIIEGSHSSRFPSNNSEPEFYEAYLQATDRDALIEDMQHRIDTIQDEVDEYNAITQVEVVPNTTNRESITRSKIYIEGLRKAE